MGDRSGDVRGIRKGFVVGPFALLGVSRVARRIRAALSAGWPTFTRLDDLRFADGGDDPQFISHAKSQLPRTQWSEVARLESSRLFIAKNENGLVLGLMQEALRRSRTIRAQYAHIDDLKPAQTILRHPKSLFS